MEKLNPVFYRDAQTVSVEFKSLMGGWIFDNPKNWKDLVRVCSDLTHKEHVIILDFFSGSATTAHAVMPLNTEDGCHPQQCRADLQAPKPGDRSPSDLNGPYHFKRFANF